MLRRALLSGHIVSLSLFRRRSRLKKSASECLQSKAVNCLFGHFTVNVIFWPIKDAGGGLSPINFCPKVIDKLFEQNRIDVRGGSRA
jgi:hypothetical protein